MNKFEKSLQFILDKIGPKSPFYRKIYLVGGCVRDELLGERYTDLDLLIDMPDGQRKFVEYMCATYPDTCRGPFYYQRYGTTAMDIIFDRSLTLVECVEPHIENYADDGVTLLETRFCSLQEDAQRRDYTCNALYKNLHTGQVLDPTGRGLDDLNAGLLRTPGDPVTIYRQDPVRMLRGVRFKHQKGFRLDDAAWQAIVQNHAEMAKSAPKRLRDELHKILKTKTFGEAVNDLYISGLLTFIMPGLPDALDDPTPLDGMAEPMTLWQHTRLALYTLIKEHPFTDTQSKLCVLMADIAARYGTDRVTELLLAAQIGKEKVGSIVHTLQMYQRYCGFYDEEHHYVARPRELPHFLVAIGKIQAEFRRLVRALNAGRTDAAQAPINPLYANVDATMDLGGQAQSTVGKEHRQAAGGTRSAVKVKRTASQRRRAQRRRAAARRKAQQQTTPRDGKQ